MTKRSTKKKPLKLTKKTLTASDYVLFNEMISRIRALERVATEHFLMGNVDRSKLAKALGKEVYRIHTRILPVFGRCRYPYCNSGGVCDLCLVQAAHQQMAQAVAQWQSSNGS